MMMEMKKVLLIFSAFAFLFVASPAHAVSLSLSPETSSNAKVLTVDVFIDTEGKETTGADFVGTFDRDKLRLISVNPGIIYDTYTPAIIDNNGGKVSVSGLVQPQKSYKGSGKFAQLVFEPVKNGEASINITFKKGDRNDSNVADMTGNDILAEVDNAVVAVKGKGGYSWFQNLLDILIFWD